MSLDTPYLNISINSDFWCYKIKCMHDEMYTHVVKYILQLLLQQYVRMLNSNPYNAKIIVSTKI